MKRSSFRRMAAFIALVGTGTPALLAGAAVAHQQNGNSEAIGRT